MMLTAKRKGKSMIVRINKPCRVNILSGEVEVTEQEANRLLTMSLIDSLEERETRIVEKETKTRKTKK